MPYKTRTLIVLAFMTSLVLPHADAKAKPKKAQMTGHVHDQATPLAEALLQLYNCDATAGNCKDGPVRVTRSAADGSFSLQSTGLKEGIYTLEAASPPFYLSKAKVPVVLPQDAGKNFDFAMQRDVRDAAGNLLGLSHEDAEEVYAAAKIEHNQQLETAAGAKLLNENPRDDKFAQSDEGAVSGDGQSSEPAAADGDVQSSIQSAIQKDPTLASANITVDVRNGKSVALSGRVPNKDAKETAERIAKENAGGIKVKNHLKVASSESESASIEGCLSGSAGSYMLTDTSGKTWQLAGDTSKLTEHVGHDIRLTGSEGNNGASGSSSDVSGSSASSTGAGSSGAGASGSQPTFTVNKVKMISGSCSI